MSEEEFQRESEEDGLKEKIEICGAKTIGEFLLYEREKQGLSLDDIDEISRIGPRWLEAIDKGEWSAYPSLIYAKGHIRGYAGVLNLDGSRIISYFEQELKNAFPDETFHIHPVKNINQIYQPTSMGNRGGTRYKYLLLGILGVLFVSLIISKVVHRNTRIPVSVVPQALPTIPPAPNPGIPNRLNLEKVFRASRELPVLSCRLHGKTGIVFRTLRGGRKRIGISHRLFPR